MINFEKIEFEFAKLFECKNIYDHAIEKAKVFEQKYRKANDENIELKRKLEVNGKTINLFKFLAENNTKIQEIEDKLSKATQGLKLSKDQNKRLVELLKQLEKEVFFEIDFEY